MAKTTSDSRARRQLGYALRAAQSKKALDCLALDLRGLADFTDYFLLCHGSNPRQVQAIAEEIQRALRQRARRAPAHVEGQTHGEWIVLDYLDFVVHVFSAASRQFYALERLWQRAPQVPLAGLSRAAGRTTREKSA